MRSGTYISVIDVPLDSEPDSESSETLYSHYPLWLTRLAIPTSTPHCLKMAENVVVAGFASNELYLWTLPNEADRIPLYKDDFCSPSSNKLTACAHLEPAITFIGHTGYVWTICIGGEYLFSGSFDHTVRMWSLETGQLMRTFTDHTNEIASLQVSPDCRTLLSAGCDRYLRIFDLRGDQHRHSPEFPQQLAAIAWQGGNRCIATDWNAGIYFFDLRKLFAERATASSAATYFHYTQQKLPKLPHSTVRSLHMDLHNNRACMASFGSNVILWELSREDAEFTGEPVAKLNQAYSGGLQYLSPRYLVSGLPTSGQASFTDNKTVKAKPKPSTATPHILGLWDFAVPDDSVPA